MAACINAGIYKLLTAGSANDLLLMAHNQIASGVCFLFAGKRAGQKGIQTSLCLSWH
ncbi:hypothetical protein FAM23168_00216 [Lentilactobacillus parabuchneri]|nr:hypothetical protein FAM23168_00216 [Lentilactobacillus parabuchneri]